MLLRRRSARSLLLLTAKAAVLLAACLLLSAALRGRRPQGAASIPKVVHQMTGSLRRTPAAYSEYVRSWLLRHPEHEYWLWTDSALRRLAANWTRRLLASNLEFSDTARYFLMLHYGGVYADLDVRARADIGDYLRLHNEGKAAGCSCFLGQEPTAHAVLLFNLPFLPSNAIMACRPGHQFFRSLIDWLPAYVARRARVLPAEAESRQLGFGAHKYTGPLMLYRFLQRHRRKCKRPECSVCLMRPGNTMPYVDVTQRETLRQRCAAALRRLRLLRLPGPGDNLQSRFCWHRRSEIEWRPAAERSVFTEHDFLHMAYGSQTDPPLQLNFTQLAREFPNRVTLRT